MSDDGIHVAVVDDDLSVRTAFARLLSVSAFDVRTYESARQFLGSLDDTAAPECLIVDLQMPEITGLELQDQLKQRGFDIPTIVVTAFNEPGIRERCQLAGAVAFLLKPVRSEVLIAAIGAALKPSPTS